MSAIHSQMTKDARALLYDLVVACRAYDSTKPAHVNEYSFALDTAEAFLQVPRQDGPDSGTQKDIARLDWLEQQQDEWLVRELVCVWMFKRKRYSGMRDAIDAAMSDATEGGGKNG